MSLNKKTTTYMFKQTFNNMPSGTDELGRFPSGIGDNGEISLNTKYSPPNQGINCSLDIFIEKTNKLPMQVDMRLTLSEEYAEGPLCLTQSSNDWQDSIYFNDVQLEFMDRCFITLSITWTLPDSLVWSNPSHSNFLGLSEFALSPILSDVTIRIGDEKICTHKVVLGAASPVLLSALTSPMREVAENSIDIKDVEAEVMKAILKCLYTGKHEDFDDFEMAMKVLVVAEKYAMDKFKVLIEHKLMKWVTIDHALEILDHADTHRAENLKKECIKFIIEHSSEVVHNEYFDKIIAEKPLLMKQFTLGLVEAANKQSPSIGN